MHISSNKHGAPNKQNGHSRHKTQMTHTKHTSNLSGQTHTPLSVSSCSGFGLRASRNDAKKWKNRARGPERGTASHFDRLGCHFGTILGAFLDHFGAQEPPKSMPGTHLQKRLIFDGFWCPQGGARVSPVAEAGRALAWWENTIYTLKPSFYCGNYHIGRFAVRWPPQGMSITE